MFRLREFLSRSWPSLILAAILLLLLTGAVSSPRGPHDLLVLRRRQAQLETRREHLVVQQRTLETEIQNLRSNRSYIERMIRRELCYARPNELVYKFTKPAPQP